MFTGIVESMAEVLDVSRNQLGISKPIMFDDVSIGSSICVSGVCLSVVKMDEESLSFDVVPETAKCTKLGSLKTGDKVNLERAMKYGDRFDGHVVMGHCEGTGIIQNLKLKIQNCKELVIELPGEIAGNVVSKGSIAIDGVSLTVAEKDGNNIKIALIPHTAENTTLGLLVAGDKVNIETDVLLRNANIKSEIRNPKLEIRNPKY